MIVKFDIGRYGQLLIIFKDNFNLTPIISTVCWMKNTQVKSDKYTEKLPYRRVDVLF